MSIAAKLRALANERRQEAQLLDQLAQEAEAPPTQPDPWLSLAEAKKRRGRGRDAILAAYKRGDLKLRRSTSGRRDWQVRQSDLDAWATPVEVASTSSEQDDWIARQVERAVTGA